MRFLSLAAALAAAAVLPSATAQTAAGDLEALFWQRRADAQTDYTPADVAFMTGMIGHHAQALVMSRLAPANGASRPVRTLAARIINAQRDEIATMQRWLRDRDEPVPHVTEAGETMMPPGVADPHAGHAMPTGTMPTGTMPTGTMPTGTMPTGTMPTGTMPTGTMPSYAMPDAGGRPGHAEPAGGDHHTASHHGGGHEGHDPEMHARHVADGTHARHVADGTHARHVADGTAAAHHAGDADHASAGHGMRHAAGDTGGMTMMDHAGMPGMLSAAQLDELRAARGADFDRLFLRYMIQHHSGAIVMVDELIAQDGAAQDEQSFRLAADVRVDQTTEIARMQRMLDAMTD